MRRAFVLLAAAAVALGVTGSAVAQTPETPFPSPKVISVFVSSYTVTAPGNPIGDGVLTNFFTRGESVLFRVFVVDSKTGRVLTNKDVKYAYVAIPGRPNVKLTYRGLGSRTDQPARWTWSGTWTVPADQAFGIVSFAVKVKSNAKRYGSFVQIPVGTSQLTISRS